MDITLLPTISIAAALVVLLSGIRDLIDMIGSLRWLKIEQGKKGVAAPQEAPSIAILLPVLREQKLIVETLRVFATLKYSHSRLHILVITTQKEIAQREQAVTRLNALASDIACGHLSTPLLVERYLGVFAESVLWQILAQCRAMHDAKEIYQLLLKEFSAYPTTIDLVKEQVATLNQELDAPQFIHLHYPCTAGDMSDQLAYAVRLIRSHQLEPDLSAQPTYLAVYNADSRPHPDTLKLVAQLCAGYAQQHDGLYPPALQQSAIYLENINAMPGRRGRLLQASALLQTRWVLSHELPRLRLQSRAAPLFRLKGLPLWQRLLGAEFALCVGHGFFLRSDLAEFFFTSGLADDLLWSFRLCTLHLPILPIPLLESAESPVTLKSLLIQKRSWFFGYIEYFRCRREALRERKADRLTIELVTAHGLARGLKWLLLSPFIFAALMLPAFLLSWRLFLLGWIAYAVYGLFSYGVILGRLEQLRRLSGGTWEPGSLSWWRRGELLALSVPAFLLESVGLWGCLLQRLHWTLAHTPAYKLKTER